MKLADSPGLFAESISRIDEFDESVARVLEMLNIFTLTTPLF
jgi:hypothetical protein